MEACGKWDAEMHDLVNLLPGSSLDPVSFQKADDNLTRLTTNYRDIRILVLR